MIEELQRQLDVLVYKKKCFESDLMDDCLTREQVKRIIEDYHNVVQDIEKTQIQLEGEL